MKIPIAVVIVNRRILVLHRPVECTVLFGQAVKSALQLGQLSTLLELERLGPGGWETSAAIRASR